MVKSLINYINNNYSFSRDEDICIKELNDLSEFIIKNFIEELSFSDAIELLKSSNLLCEIIEYLVSRDSQLLKDLYYNQINLSTLLIAYFELVSKDLDIFLYGDKPKKGKVLDNKEAYSLIARAQCGDNDAKTILYQYNVGLVKKVANYYTSRYSIDFEDLFQQGCIGLLKAIDKFDLSLGYRFSTYATWWIRQEINRYCEDNVSTIKIPAHVRELLYKIRIVSGQYYSNHGVYPDDDELASILGIPVNKVRETLDIRVDSTVSLEQKVKDEEDASELGDFISDAYNLEEESLNSTRRTNLLNVLDDVLETREKQVILFRFGFYGRIYRLEEIGKLFSVTRERIRQIEGRALRKLQQPSVKQKLIEDGNEQLVKKISGIRFYFPNTSLEELRVLVPLLPDSQAATTYKLFGRKLTGYYSVNNININIFANEIVPNIKILLAGGSIEKSSKSIFEVFSGFSELAVKSAIDKLPEKQKVVVYAKYGHSLNELRFVTAEENSYLVGTIIPNIGKLLRGVKINSGKAIFDWFPTIPENEVRAAISKLSQGEKEILFYRFGKNLDEYNDVSDQKSNYLLSTIRNHISRLLKGEDIPKNKEDIFDWFPEYTKEQIAFAVSKLPTKYRDIVYNRYGKDLNELNQTMRINNQGSLKKEIRDAIAKILRGETVEVSAKSLSLVEFFSDYSKEQIFSAIRKLTNDERRILRLKYGNNYDEVISVPREVASMVAKVRNHLKALLIELNSDKKSIYEIIGLDKSVIDRRIDCLSNQDKECLYKYYGYDLVNPVNVMVDDEITIRVERVIIPRLRRASVKEKQFVSKLYYIAERLHDNRLLMSFTPEEIVIGYILYSMRGLASNDYLINLLDITKERLLKLLKFMEKKKMDSISYIGEMVSECLVKEEQKNATIGEKNS